MKHLCTGVILAGGGNRRMAGRNKALLPLCGKPMLGWVVETLGEIVDEILLITNDPVAFLDWDVTIVTDIHAPRSSLTGLHTALYYAPRPYVFIVPCDMPYIQKGLIRLLLDQIEPCWDVIVPETAEGFEPLCAVYSKRCLKTIECQIERGDLRISSIFEKMRVKKIPETAMRSVDPALGSFFNVNDPKSFRQAEAICARRSLSTGQADPGAAGYDDAKHRAGGSSINRL